MGDHPDLSTFGIDPDEGNPHAADDDYDRCRKCGERTESVEGHVDQIFVGEGARICTNDDCPVDR